jgi:hypothetical protein
LGLRSNISLIFIGWLKFFVLNGLRLVVDGVGQHEEVVHAGKFPFLQSLSRYSTALELPFLASIF